MQLTLSPDPIQPEPTGPGELIGYLAVFDNIDRAGEVIRKGAFARSLAALGADPTGAIALGRVPLLSRHVMDNADAACVVGSIIMAREDDHGLLIRAVFATDPTAQEIRAKVREGHLRHLSVGYLIKRDNRTRDYRELLELELLEGSLVPVPANPEAVVLGGKSANTDKQTCYDDLARVRQLLRRAQMWRLSQ